MFTQGGVVEIPFSYNSTLLEKLRDRFGNQYLNIDEKGKPLQEIKSDAPNDPWSAITSINREKALNDILENKEALDRYTSTGTFGLSPYQRAMGLNDERVANAILSNNYELQRQANPSLYSDADKRGIKYTPLTTLEELQRKIDSEEAYRNNYSSLRTELRGVQDGGKYLAQNPQLSRSARTGSEGSLAGSTQLQNLEAKLDELKTAARVRDEERTDTIRDATQEDDLEKIEKDKAGQLAITERQEAGATARQTLANQGALEVATLQGNTSIQNTNSTNRTNLQSLQATLQDSAEGRRLDQEQFLAQLADAAAARSADNKIAMAQFQAQMEMAQRRDERAERRDQKNDRMAMITMLMKGLSQLGAGFAL